MHATRRTCAHARRRLCDGFAIYTQYVGLDRDFLQQAEFVRTLVIIFFRVARCHIFVVAIVHKHTIEMSSVKCDVQMDVHKVYRLPRVRICADGNRAICIDIPKVQDMPHNVDCPHVTIFFRKDERFTYADVRGVQAKADELFSDIGAVEFSLSKWGDRSYYIHGALKDLCEMLRQSFPATWNTGEPRALHVTLFQ
jgi:hypothetical protein